eukprot:scaffold33582_cov60-Phaeocystis_antarctica.AAC.3
MTLAGVLSWAPGARARVSQPSRSSVPRAPRCATVTGSSFRPEQPLSKNSVRACSCLISTGSTVNCEQPLTGSTW